MDVVRADCGRLRPPAGHPSQPPVVISRIGELQEALDRAERTVGRLTGPALAVRLSSGHVLAVARAGAAFSALDRELVEQLGAHAALALENQRLYELMYQADEELRGILEGVAEAVMVEDASGQILYRNPAADALLPNLTDLATTLGVPATALPGWRLFNGEAPRPFVVRHPDRRRWSRVKSAAIPPHGPPRLAVSAIEDISDIKRAEEAQRFLAESSRVLATSLDLDDTLPRLERLAAGWMGGHWRITVRATPADPPPGEALHVPIRVRGGVAGEITLSDMQVGPLETAIAEDLGLRVGAAVDLFRVYRSRAVIAQTLQASLLPAVPPEIAGLETAGLYRPAGTRSDVSGDFYDVFSTGPDTWNLVSGDVRGRGAEAAALSNLARHTVREAAAGDRSPAEILRRVNEVFLGRREGAFLGVACGRLDLQMDPAAVTVACGGHPAPRVLRASGVVEAFGSEGTLLGVLAAVEVDDRVTALHRGDALIFYTDGLLKAEAPAAWDTEQLHTIVAAAVGQTAQGIVEHLAATVEGPLRDDLALLAVRVKPAP
jgi:serine phosphatase RsbU (regulator of sigma subunit)/PAS domain-containing protein